MKQPLTLLRYLLALVGTVAVVVTLLSMAPEPAAWWLQVLKFPRLQLLIVHALVLAGLGLAGAKRHRVARGLLLLGTSVGLGLQAYFILPYTGLGNKNVPDASPTQSNNHGSRLSLLIVNVLMENRDAESLRQLVYATQPDVLLAMETDGWWTRALRPLQPQYPYRVELPRGNTYGMVLYSRLPLENIRVRYLEHPQVPSIHADLRLPNGRLVAFHGVHPPPPVPLHYLVKGPRYKEVTLLKVGNLVQQKPGPAIVAGDFNDVSWSHTTRLFEADGRLRNVRLGRGLYNSFRATSLVLRWPLDHIFVTQHFRLGKLQRLPRIHSDHFPIYAELVLPNKVSP
jgi:endonuclease/exonuclease/phosphatase (EEP) superfamily protein YafD